MSTTVSPQLLLEVGVRVSAELGRAQMAVAGAVGLPTGAIVELDRSHDQPVDLYVNGRHFGTGRLLIVDGEWAVRIESVNGVATPPPVEEEPDSFPAIAEAAFVAEAPPITPVNSSSDGQG